MSPEPAGMDPGREAPPREFAAAFLGHSRDSHGELECNFRVTHLPSGVFWLVRRPLSEWQHLEERLLREAGRLPGPASAPASAASRRSSGFFFRRSSDVSRKQLEALQAQLAVILSDSELRDSSVLQDFLGVPAQAPEMPSSVRIVNLRRCHDGEAEVQLEVQTTSEKALVEGRTSATHVVATVLLLRPKGADEELEEIGDFKVPAGSREPLTIHGLEADRAYEFQVKTVNDVGSSPGVRIRVLVPTDLPEPVQPHQGVPEVARSKTVPNGAADFLGNVPADTSMESQEEVTAEPTELPQGTAQASSDKLFAADTSEKAPASLHQEEAVVEEQASGEADKPALAEATMEIPAPDTSAEASCSEPAAAKETPADGLASLQQQASGEADKPALAEAAVTGQKTFLPMPLPEVEAADAIDTVSATVEMPAPDALAEASRDEPSAAKETSADGPGSPDWGKRASQDLACLQLQQQQQQQQQQQEAVVEQQASGEADRPALAEAAVTGLETVLPAPLPAEIKADAVDTASCSEPAAAKETPADGLVSLQQQAGGEADKPAPVEATVEMPAPAALAEASRDEPSAAKETSADGLACLQQQQEADVEQQASGEADKPALAEAAVTGLETVLPAPLPAEVRADAVDTATVEAPVPDTSAEASCSEPAAAKETPADGLASLQQQAVEGSKTAAINAESLSNGQPQKLDPARLKLKEGDPYLSPHARALVNDEEGATFPNGAEEVRSPQRESSARSLQPPSAGFARVGTLEVRLSQLPDKKAVGAAMDEAIAHLETYYKVSEQTAVRLYLGCNLDMEEAKRRFDGILEWRKQYGVDQMRLGLLSALRADEPVMVPFHKEVAKLVTINPCALTSAEGSPVSIYYVGTAHSSAAPKADEDQLRRFGVFVAEYVDVWLSAQTTTTGKLAGHVQIYDLQGLSLWQVSSGALVEKLKILLGAGQHYMEQVSHIFVIRSSSAFSMAWNFIKGWISPRTASKIHVSSSIPSELQKLLGPSAAALPALLKNPQWTAAVQRPPFTSEE